MGECVETVTPVHSVSSLARALGRIPSGIFIVTLLPPECPPMGAMVSLVQQVSFGPPVIAVAVRGQSGLATALASVSKMVVNVCHSGDKVLVPYFASGSKAGPEAFAPMAIRPSLAGPPILVDACAYLECSLIKTVDFGGDHVLFLAQVEAGELMGDVTAKPKVHLRFDGMGY